MKTLKFYHNLAEEILIGKKTVTWRMFDDKNLIVGDQVEFIETETGEKFAEAEITDIKEKKLGEVAEKDFDGHETYKNREEMLKQYQKYYGNAVTMETPVKIISFKIK